MAEHAHTTPVTLARRRHVRAAPGAMDRRWPAPETPAPTKPTVARPPRKPAGSTKTKTLVLRLSRTEDDGLPLDIDWRYGFGTLPGYPAVPLEVDWTGLVNPDLRRRIERHVDLLIAFLDAVDAITEDLEPDDEGKCVEDDVLDGSLFGLCNPHPDAMEDDEPSDANDQNGSWLDPVDGHGFRGSLVVA